MENSFRRYKPDERVIKASDFRDFSRSASHSPPWHSSSHLLFHFHFNFIDMREAEQHTARKQKERRRMKRKKHEESKSNKVGWYCIQKVLKHNGDTFKASYQICWILYSSGIGRLMYMLLSWAALSRTHWKRVCVFVCVCMRECLYDCSMYSHYWRVWHATSDILTQKSDIHISCKVHVDTFKHSH